MRAPRECGSWFSDHDEVVEPGLELALRTAAGLSTVPPGAGSMPGGRP